VALGLVVSDIGKSQLATWKAQLLSWRDPHGDGVGAVRAAVLVSLSLSLSISGKVRVGRARRRKLRGWLVQELANRPVGQIWPMSIFCTAHELRMVFRKKWIK